MSKTRLVVAESCTLYRQGLVALLAAQDDFVVVGEAANAEEARRVCIHAEADVVLLGAGLLQENNSESDSLLAALRVCCPRLTCALIGERNSGETNNAPSVQRERRRALERGAAAYLPADVDKEELMRTLRALSAPQEGLPSKADTETKEPTALSAHSVTERERAIVALIAQGLCNKEIAGRLGISAQTVKNHVSHLLEKLALADRTHLAVYALEHHLIPHSTDA